MKERQSGVELLRLVSMAGILMLHSDAACIGLPQHTSLAELLGSWSMFSRHLVEAATVGATDLFILISGYFGMRFKWRSLLTFIAMALAYSLLTFAVSWIWWPEGCTAKLFTQSIVIFSPYIRWFILAYALLLTLSPLINLFLSKVGEQRWGLVGLAAFAMAMVEWKVIGRYGYDVTHLVIIYLLGRTIRHYRLPERMPKWLSLGIYVAFTGLVMLSVTWWEYKVAYAMNSPFVLIAAMGLFIFFASLKFRSRAVNWLAGSAFAVYLTHMSPALWVHYREMVRYLAERFPDSLMFSLALGGFIAAVFFGSLLFDKFTFQPLWNALLKRFTPKAHKPI